MSDLSRCSDDVAKPGKAPHRNSALSQVIHRATAHSDRTKNGNHELPRETRFSHLPKFSLPNLSQCELFHRRKPIPDLFVLRVGE